MLSTPEIMQERDALIAALNKSLPTEYRAEHVPENHSVRIVYTDSVGKVSKVTSVFTMALEDSPVSLLVEVMLEDVASFRRMYHLMADRPDKPLKYRL